MKKLWLLSIVLFVSCDMYWDFHMRPEVDIEFSSVQDAWAWITKNITYTRDMNGDRWQFPEYTYAIRQGDCEDFAILLACFAFRLGHYCEIVGIEEETANHAVLCIDGIYYEPMTLGQYYSDSFIKSREILRYNYGYVLGNICR